MKIVEDVDLSQLSFMKIGGKGKYLVQIENEKDLEKVWEMKQAHNLPIFILGEGSNTIFADGNHNKIFVQVLINDIIKTYENDFAVNIEVGAGCNWDNLVAWTVKNNLSGIECLSGIPGTVGASPIQNIGAYGSEVSDTITHVKIFDLEDGKFYEISAKDCKFSYRDSVFKRNPGKFIVISVSFRLSKSEPKIPEYKDLSLYFLGNQEGKAGSARKNQGPNLAEIREAVLEIRGEKLPNPAKDPNCGSFFKNPVLSNDEVKNLVKRFPDIPQFKFSDKETKLSGGWLIEKSGFKGKEIGNFRVSDKNALVLISNGKADFAELEKVKNKIIEGVEKNFGVTLEVEPVFVV